MVVKVSTRYSSGTYQKSLSCRQLFPTPHRAATLPSRLRLRPSTLHVQTLMTSFISLLLYYTITGQVSQSSHDSVLASHTPSGAGNVIAQMFEWSWNSIAAECTEFLGPAGYEFVQISPPQEHVTGPQWWTAYQPVSYALTSRRGNRTELQNMISTCHAAGVKVIVDTIYNHMAGFDYGIGIGGSGFTHYNYPGIYQYQDFHHCGLQTGDSIIDYTNRLEVQTCELVELADLATGTEYVRGRLAQYTNDLLSLGVDGLRIDAAKHIAAEDVTNIIGRLNTRPYITQEVIWGHGEPILPSEYIDNGDVQEFRYTFTLKNAFLSEGISTLVNLDNRGWIPSDQANVFVANHDTERNGASLNLFSPSNTYITATIFSLAYPYGRPTILSSYSGFSNTDLGPPNDSHGTCSGTGGSNGWLCQHRFTAVVGMVGFRNHVGSAAITNWVSPHLQQIAFGRGSAGFVAINNVDAPWNTKFVTSMPDGSYCDVVSGTSSLSSCSGTSFIVAGGYLTATVPSRGAIAIHTGAKGVQSGSERGEPAPVAVSFSETATTTFGENIFLVGSAPQLGSWDPELAIPLSPETYPVWTVTVSLPPDAAFEYKFIRKTADGDVVWEAEANHQARVIGSGTQVFSSVWR